MNNKVISLSIEYRFQNETVLFTPKVVHRDDDIDTDNISKAEAFIQTIWNCKYEPKLEQYSEIKAQIKTLAFFFSTILTFQSLAKNTISLVNTLFYKEDLDEITVNSCLFMLGVLGMALTFSSFKNNIMNTRFYRKNELLRESEDPVLRLQAAEAGANYSTNYLIFEKGKVVPDIIVHEMVHLMKKEGLTKGNSDLYLATAVGYHYKFIEEGPFFPLAGIESHMAGDLFAARYFDHLVYQRELEIDPHTQVYLDNIDGFNSGELSSEKENGYATGIFLAAVINRLYDMGAPKPVLARVFRQLGGGRGLIDCLNAHMGNFFKF